MLPSEDTFFISQLNNDLSDKPSSLSIFAYNSNYVSNYVSRSCYDSTRHIAFVNIAFKVLQSTNAIHLLPEGLPAITQNALIYTKLDDTQLPQSATISGRNINVSTALSTGDYLLTGWLVF